MTFRILWQAKDDLRSLEQPIRKRVIKKIRSIEENPLRFVERLVGYSLFKLRIGDYRAIIDIKQEANQIIVVLVGHRSQVYKELSRL